MNGSQEVVGSNPSLSATFISSMLISIVLEAKLHTWCTIWGLSMPDEDLLRNCVPLRWFARYGIVQNSAISVQMHFPQSLTFSTKNSKQLIISFVTYLYR